MKTRKQWIAMLLMLAMLFTALPLAAFAEGEPEAPAAQEEKSTPPEEENTGEAVVKPMQAPGEASEEEDQGNKWAGEWDQMQVEVQFGLGNDNIGEQIYKSDEWNNAPKNLTPDELTALEDFYNNLLTDATFEWQNDAGKWVKFTPTEWKINKYAPHLRSIDVPKHKKVRMTVSTSRLPENFSLGGFQDFDNRAYIADTSKNPYNAESYITLRAIKYKVIFNAGEGAIPNVGKTYECFINRDGEIKYPDKPTREGYLFHDWIVPIYYKEDLSFGGGSDTGIITSPTKKEGMSEHVAILEHGKTDEPYLWTYNHFWWAFERDQAKSENPRTLYARWERPTLTFYKDPDTTKTDVLETMKAYNGKSLNETDWAQNTDLVKIAKLPKAKAPAGMKFKGWVYYDASNGKHDFDMTTKVDGNMKLYPVFEKKAAPDPGTPSVPSTTYEWVIFEANGGAWANGETKREQRVPVGRSITIESAPIREGYKFLYWKGSEYHPGESYIVPDGGHTFVAQWEKDEKKPESPIVDSKIKTPRGSALTPEEIAKILAGMKKAVPAIPRAGVGR